MLIKVKNPEVYKARIDHYLSMGFEPCVARLKAFTDSQRS